MSDRELRTALEVIVALTEGAPGPLLANYRAEIEHVARAALTTTEAPAGLPLIAWYSPCGYFTEGLFAAASPIPTCPECHSTAWSTSPPPLPHGVAYRSTPTQPR